MSKGLPVSPAPRDHSKITVPVSIDLFGARAAQREGFRRYLEGLLLPAERNKT